MAWFLTVSLVSFLLSFIVLFLIMLHYKYKETIGIEARRTAFKEAISSIETDINQIINYAPKRKMFFVLSTKIMVLNHAKEKLQYLLDKTT